VYTLTEYGYFSEDTLKKNVLVTIIKSFPLFDRLPFMDIVGNAYAFNLQKNEGGMNFYQPHATWVEKAPGIAQRTTTLTTLGGDADIDKFMKKTRSNLMDLEGETLRLRSLEMANAFGKQMIVGQTTTTPEPNAFKSLTQWIAEYETLENTSTVDLDGINNEQVYPCHATSATLTLDMVDAVIDRVLSEGDQVYLMMSKRMRRKLTSLCRAAGANLGYTSLNSELGIQAEQYNKAILLVNDHILDNWPDASSSVQTIASYAQATTRAATLDNSPIFAFCVGPNAVCGLQNGGVEVTPLGELETKRASRFRLAWDCGLAVFNPKKIAVAIAATDGL
jgi:hypothetical protein